MKTSSMDTELSEHCGRLTQLIQSEIKSSSNQSITFARYMELALYAPGLGYYSAGSQKIGPQGDFLTAPEISPYFAHCIASQAALLFKEGAGDFLEVGAGSGRFAKDFITYLSSLDVLPKHYYILETSADLRDRQQQFLQKECAELYSLFVWLDSPPVHFTGMIFANELLDALPVHCFRKESILFERCVTFQNNAFEWCLQNASDELQEHFNVIETHRELPNHYESEINLLTPRLITSLTHCLTKGILLLFDYGYGRREYYHSDRHRGTLKCFYRHKHHDNPFIHLGMQDITAHVDFTSVAEAATHAGARLLGYTTQSGFLLASGLLELADNPLLPIDERYNQAQAIKTLTLPSQMGELIKVIGLAKNTDMTLPGFELIDRRRDL